MVDVPPPGTPRTAGSWPTTISTAMPASTPVMTGAEKRSDTQPSRSSPAATTSTPTMSAKTGTRCA